MIKFFRYNSRDLREQAEILRGEIIASNLHIKRLAQFFKTE